MFHLCFSLQPRLSNFPLSLLEDLKSKPFAHFCELGGGGFIRHIPSASASLSACRCGLRFLHTHFLMPCGIGKNPANMGSVAGNLIFGYLNSTCCSGSIESLLFHSQVFSCGFASPFSPSGTWFLLRTGWHPAVSLCQVPFW